MGKRQPETREEWEQETSFIERASASETQFAGFDSYCQMQERFCREDGFDDLADRIRKAKEGAWKRTF